MASRTIAAGLGDEVMRLGKPLWESQDPRNYISYLCDDPNISGLLWREVKRMIRWASDSRRGCMQLTERQVMVLELYLLGHTGPEIAERFGITRQAVNDAKQAAINKIARYKPRERGLLTVMIEEMDWRQVREYLAAIADERHS